MSIKVGIIGATGYTGMELYRILANHPEVEICLATSERYAGTKLGTSSITLEKLDDKQVAKRCTFAFSCLPHREAMDHIPTWINKGTKVVDLSADFRFSSPEVYAEWYEPHKAPELLEETIYGLPELYRNEIRKAFLVGNPGCYPTGAVLGLAPLLRERIIGPDRIIIDSKSGVTGAGRSAAVETLFAEVNDSVHAYKVGTHRHTPEIEQELSLIAGREIKVSFTPHLIPMDRGILSTLYASSLRKTDTQGVLKVLDNFYKKEPFVRVLPEGILPKTKEVRGTNNCLIGAIYDSRTNQVVVVTAIDNLMKGAASQAVHNMNLMHGLDETLGLQDIPFVP